VSKTACCRTILADMTRPPRPIELVIFDCDGVLVDSERIAVQVDLVVLGRVGLEITEAEVIDRFVGRSPAVMRLAIEDHLGYPLDPALQQEFEQLYVDAFDSELCAVDGIQEALARIHQDTCVASSSEPESLHRKLRHVGLLAHFEGRIFSASEVRNGKPAPDLFLHAANRMGVPPDRCAVVEDSQWGVLAARAAGMEVFAYATGLTDPRQLTGARTTLFTDMRDLPELLRHQTA
jgi:HAD superfamily hydrolase (TIGR01509 family)